MPIYTVASDLDAEVIYACSLPKLWLNSDKVKRSPADLAEEELPPGIRHRVIRHGVDLNPAEMKQAIMDDPRPLCDVAAFEASLYTGIEVMKVIFERHFSDPPRNVHIHLTRYGSGGSYHPVGRHGLARLYGPTISVRPDLRKETPLFITAHETIHLAIETTINEFKNLIVSNRMLYRIKEALVDQILSADEFVDIGGPFPIEPNRSFLTNYLPDNWQNLPCFGEPLHIPNTPA